ncbi:MAG: protein-L-isoaspartate O-methyltransferase, partial [Pseudonocardiaceae bacterium]
MNDGLADRLRAGLVTKLVSDGSLRSPRLISAFRRVPRHVFLPKFFRPTGDGFGYTPVSAETGEEEWLRLAYADDAWTTQLDADPSKWREARASGTISGTPTSSSTAPGLMARM